jgi:hypothetical protein
MTNDIATARKWTEFVARRPEFSPGIRLVEQFELGDITDLCPCGCNSFSIKLPTDTAVSPLVPPSENGGASFVIEFEAIEPKGTLEFIVYTDPAGNFDGLDVHFNANTEPVPQDLRIAKEPYHVYGPLARKA